MAATMQAHDQGRDFATQVLGSLRAVSAARQSGTLTVRGGAATKKLFFHQGHVLAVASAEAAERLGHYLVGWGFITQQQLAGLLDEQRDVPRGLGELVVARRLVDRDAMSLLLRIRAEDAVFDLVRWSGGECRFARDVTPVRDYLELRLPVEPLVADLERLLVAWRRIGVRVPGPRDVPFVERRTEFRTLSMREADVLRLVDGKRTLSEVAMLSRASQFEVLVTLQNHAQDGLVRFRSGAPPAAAEKPHWAELLREAENSLAFADLLEAYDLLCRALRTADTSRLLQEKAMAIEHAILQRVVLPEGSVLAPVERLREGTTLGDDERQLVAAVDGRKTLGEVLDAAGGDRTRRLLVAHALVQHGILAAGPARSTRG
jgi:hypothetical protein